MQDGLLEQLEHGDLHRFSDFAGLGDAIPGSGAGVYTIWDEDGGLVYAGGSRGVTQTAKGSRVD